VITTPNLCEKDKKKTEGIDHNIPKPKDNKENKENFLTSQLARIFFFVDFDKKGRKKE